MPVATPTAAAILDRLGLAAVNPGVSTGPGDWALAPAAALHTSDDPSTGAPLAQVQLAGDAEYDRAVAAAQAPGENRLAQAQQIEQIIATTKEIHGLVEAARKSTEEKFEQARQRFAAARQELASLPR